MNPEEDALVFQCKDIVSRDTFPTQTDAESDPDSESDKSERDVGSKQFQMILFGTTKDGKSVALQIENFSPFFYVRIPVQLASNKECIKSFKQWVMNGVPSSVRITLTLEYHKFLYDFNNNESVPFLKITVPSMNIWRNMKNRFLDSTSVPIGYETRSMFGVESIPETNDIANRSMDGTKIALRVYEANIDPVLRYFHIQNISPAGWVQVAPLTWEYAESNDAKVDIYAVCDHVDVQPVQTSPGIAPYLIASWDIECNSSHGDFPVASKTWRKTLRELMDAGLPTSVESLCDALADAINGTSTRLSTVYLKRPANSTMFGETLRFMLEGKNKLHTIASHLNALHANRDTEKALQGLDKVLTEGLPQIAGDEIIQIGTVLYKHGIPLEKHIWVLGSCNTAEVRPPGEAVPIHVYPAKTELEMLKRWFAWIGKCKPDVLIGYNIFGFDSKYVWDRLHQLASEYEIKGIVSSLSSLRSRPPRLEEKFLSSSAMGDNTMWFMSSAGRLQIDLLPYIRRNYNLDSYSLDNVSATFVSGSLSGLKPIDADTFRFTTKSTKGIVVGRYITLLDEENDRVVDRCLVSGIEPKALVVSIKDGANILREHGLSPVRWAQVKDDVSPKDIFRLHRGSASDRAIIAKYCLQDCDLVMELFNKLEILNNSFAMADVCSVPVSFIFTRGQGIKIESLIFKECRKVDQLIEVLPSQSRNEEEEDGKENEDSYEGAIVLEPHTGIYLDDPVTADDFASLYPSSIISENISHDTLIWVKDYTNDGAYICTREGSDAFDNLPGQKYVNIEFDILRVDPADTRKHPEKIRDGRRIARYIQNPQGTIPRILEMLLASRKKCRKMAETEPDEFRKSLLDAQQLAYKVTANSLYGQLGSGTFKIRRQVLAASTTAYGRKQLMFAKTVIESVYGGGKDPRCNVECVYGDTDSIFLRFQPRNPETGERLRGKEALRVAKELTIESGKLVSACLKPPHDFEFDKIFKSFILLSKKRYVGDMSEDGVEDEDFHRKSMGIVMKRRDNAPIVKYVYGGAIERILTTNDVRTGLRSASEFVMSATKDLLQGKFPLHKLTITKSLRAEYADPTRIAHKVLADRIGERDPGNKPSTSDRIPFVYIQHTGGGSVPKLQGDRIETPSYIKEHNLTPDYAFYITNQIAKPVAQVFGLGVEELSGVSSTMMDAIKKAKDPVEAREKLAEYMLFGRILQEAERDPKTMESKGQKSIASMFKKSKV